VVDHGPICGNLWPTDSGIEAIAEWDGSHSPATDPVW